MTCFCNAIKSSEYNSEILTCRSVWLLAFTPQPATWRLPHRIASLFNARDPSPSAERTPLVREDTAAVGSGNKAPREVLGVCYSQPIV